MAGDGHAEFKYDIKVGKFAFKVRRHEMVLGWIGVMAGSYLLFGGKKKEVVAETGKPAPKKI